MNKTETEGELTLEGMRNRIEKIAEAIKGILDDFEAALPDDIRAVDVEEHFGPAYKGKTLSEIIGLALTRIERDISVATDVASLKKCEGKIRSIVLEMFALLSDAEDEVKYARPLMDEIRQGKVKMQFGAESDSSPKLTQDVIRKISQGAGISRASIPKDLYRLLVEPGQDIAEDSSEKGLSEKNGFFYSFLITLAVCQAEQSRLYGTEREMIGIRQEYEKEVGGLQPAAILPGKGGKEEQRKYPVILAGFDDIAEKLMIEGKGKGGRRAKYIEEYIDKQLKNAEYKIWAGYDEDGESRILGLSLFTKIGSAYKGKRRIGYYLLLSPMWSRTGLGFTNFRADTIRLIGGARQKDITMKLLLLLGNARGIPGEFKKDKQQLLEAIGGSAKTYVGRPGKLESHFKEAVQKAKDAKLILADGYREEKSGGGVTAIFKFNPDYLKEDEAPAGEIKSGTSVQ